MINSVVRSKKIIKKIKKILYGNTFFYFKAYWLQQFLIEKSNIGLKNKEKQIHD